MVMALMMEDAVSKKTYNEEGQSRYSQRDEGLSLTISFRKRDLWANRRKRGCL
jgi:hypothetical protein